MNKTASDAQEEQEVEADLRWGQSSAYQQSSQRWSTYSDEQKQEMDAEQKAIVDDMATLMKKGHESSSAEAMSTAERHRLFISKWFYECDPWMHAQLSEMYVYDERFSAFFNDAEEGLADYFSSAVETNALALAGVAPVESALANVKSAAGLNASVDSPLRQAQQKDGLDDDNTAAEFDPSTSTKKAQKR